MTMLGSMVFGAGLAAGAGIALAAAHAQSSGIAAPAGSPPAPAPMTFFITSVGKGDGANLGGLAGADAHCRMLAAAVGRGDARWRAYLSTQGPGAVNARDRIGTGPWHNQKGQMISRDLAQLHGDTLELARVGAPLAKTVSLTEQGRPVNGAGDTPNQHDILTGSMPDGRGFTDSADHSCRNWTSNGTGAAQVGHSDRTGAQTASWNSAHPSRGCGQKDLAASGGAGLFYCFATN